MAMGWETLQTHVGANYEDDAVLQRLWTVASLMVDGWIGVNVVPTEIRDEAVLLVATELFDRAQTPSTNAGQFSDTPAAPRLVRDPMLPAYRMLRPWVSSL